MDYQQREDLKKKATIGGVGAIAGAVVWWIVLASALGWISPTTAAQQTSDAVQTKVDTALAPFCADTVMANEALLAKFTKATEDYDRAEIVQNGVPKVGSTAIDYQLSEACANAVEARLKAPTAKASNKKI